MKVFYFGNPFLENDNLAVKVCRKLEQENKNIEFEHISDTFQLIDKNLNESVLVDVVHGIKKVEFVDSSSLKQGKISSLHDFDLGFFIKLKKASPRIIGIPPAYSEELALKEVRSLLPVNS